MTLQHPLNELWLLKVWILTTGCKTMLHHDFIKLPFKNLATGPIVMHTCCIYDQFDSTTINPVIRKSKNKILVAVIWYIVLHWWVYHIYITGIFIQQTLHHHIIFFFSFNDLPSVKFDGLVCFEYFLITYQYKKKKKKKPFTILKGINTCINNSALGINLLISRLRILNKIFKYLFF